MAKTVEDLAQEVIEALMAGTDKAPKSKRPKDKVPEFDESHEEPAETKGEQETMSNTKMYSDLFGWDDSVLGNKADKGKKGTDSYVKGRDFAVRVFTEEEWTEEGLSYIPSQELFADRVIDHAVLYPFVLGMQTDETGNYDKTMLVGPTGSGKSTLVEFYCAMVKQPFFRINGRQDMESDSIIGRPWVENGTMAFKKGEIPKAMEAGWLVLFDEPFKVPSGILMTLQRMMERGGLLQIDDMPGELSDKQIKPESRHRMVLADNVVGTGDNIDKYGATLIQDSSMLNRVDMVLTVDYLPEDAEVNLVLSKFKNISKQNAVKMIRLLNLLRKGFDMSELSSPASLRNIEAWARKSVQVRSYALAFRWVLLNRYADESERNAVRGFYFDVFGEKL